jgi:hypothetical protein
VKHKILSSTLGVGVGLLAIMVAFREWRTLKQPPPPLESSPASLPRDPDGLRLKTISVSNEVQAHLLDGDFKIVRRMNEIPDNCTNIFESSFLTNSGSHGKSGNITLANPGEPFQTSDYLVNVRLPLRRLEFAGLSPTRCFIHYQKGGTLFTTYCAAVVDYPTKKTVWVGESSKAANNLDDLRRMILEQQFGNIERMAVC